MTSNKEKFLALVTENDPKFIKELEYRVANGDWLKEPFMVGIKVLVKLDELGWSQKDLAAAMDVSPQQINKIVRGKQNLTLDTLVRLQRVLDIPLLASYHEAAMQKNDKGKKYSSEEAIAYIPSRIPVSGTYVNQSGKAYKINMEFNKINQEYINIAS